MGLENRVILIFCLFCSIPSYLCTDLLFLFFVFSLHSEYSVAVTNVITKYAMRTGAYFSFKWHLQLIT